ncbi:MAG: hypothetical protein ABSF29_02785 [Tepidisphaeraceae bacterium]
MLDVVCARCGQTFEADDDAAETGEVCPYCGAPVEEDASEPMVEFQPSDDVATSIAPKPEPGIPSPLWWLAVVTVVAAFLVVTVTMLRGDNWEQQHLSELADAQKKAVAYMLTGDYRRADQQFQIIVTELSGRQIQSIYLQQLLDVARQGSAEAEHRLAIAATQPAPTTAPVAPENAPQTAQAPPQSALIDFQRRAESFPQFIRANPEVFQDSHGNWRGRQFLVWDVDTETPQADGDQSQMTLKYSCNSRTTAAHDTKWDAQTDDNFLFDEHVQAIHCQTTYEYQAGRWIAAQRDSDLQAQDNSIIRDGTVHPETILDLSDLRNLEVQHFSGPSAAR